MFSWLQEIKRPLDSDVFEFYVYWQIYQRAYILALKICQKFLFNKTFMLMVIFSKTKSKIKLIIYKTYYYQLNYYQWYYGIQKRIDSVLVTDS